MVWSLYVPETKAPNLLQSLIVTKLYKETLHSNDKTEAGLPNNWHPT